MITGPVQSVAAFVGDDCRNFTLKQDIDPVTSRLESGKLRAFKSTRIYMLQRDAFGSLAHTRSASLPSAPEEEGARRKRGKPPA